MSSNDNEDELLRSVALQNARAILLARERAEKFLWEAKKELEGRNEDLFQQREWFKVTLSSIGDGVITTDARGILTFLNPVAETLTGWKSAEAVGLPLETVFTIVHEHTGKLAENPVVKALREGAVMSLGNHIVLKRRDGTTVPIEDSAAPIRDSEVKIAGAVMVFHDVTDRRQKDEILWRLAAVIESSDDAILSMSLDAIITTWNAGAERMYGYTAQEIIGKPVTILIPPNRTDEEPEILERLKKGERIDHYETVRRTKDGTDLNVSLTVSPIVDFTGNMIGVSKIARDITRRKEDEAALWRLAAVTESSDDAILSMSLDAIITTWNAGAERMYGYKAQEVMGKSVTLLIPPNRTNEEPEILERLKKGERVDHYETVRRTKDGTDLNVSLTVSPVVDFAGNVIGASKIARDITRRKQDEAALREELAERRRAQDALRLAQDKLSRYTEDLEKQVASRTADLRDKIADLEAFSYSVSHDLRAPLRAIQSYALILAEDCGTSIGKEQRDYIRRMASAAERMDRLTQDVLCYSRMSRMDVSLRPIDLGRFLHGIVESYPLFQPPSAIVELTGPFPEVLGADALLTQCVANLLGNAVKFVAPGVVPRVWVWAETTPDGERVRLFFKDNGLGIPVGSHGKIFGIFERMSNDYEGTGIGLSIVKKGMDLMRGTVGLESKPGEGSTFWLELNQSKAAAT